MNLEAKPQLKVFEVVSPMHVTTANNVCRKDTTTRKSFLKQHDETE